MLPLPTSLDPLETSVRTPTASPSAPPTTPPDSPITFRHTGWRHDRDRVRRALHAARVSPSRLAAFDRCGADAYVMESDTEPGRLRIQASYCHDRFCVPCNVARAHRLAARLAELVRPRDVRFLTLTLAQDGRPLATRLADLTAAFRRLKRSASWRRHVTGGAWFLEVKYSTAADGWHPHLHVLATGTYYPQAELSHAWLGATGTSSVVDIRKVRRVSEVASYVTKYVAKPTSPEAFRQPDRLVEAVAALHGVRLCGTLGSWKQTLLTDEADLSGWHVLTSLQELLNQLTAHPQPLVPLTLIEAFDRPPPSGDLPSGSIVRPTAHSAAPSLCREWLQPLPGW